MLIHFDMPAPWQRVFHWLLETSVFHDEQSALKILISDSETTNHSLRSIVSM